MQDQLTIPNERIAQLEQELQVTKDRLQAVEKQLEKAVSLLSSTDNDAVEKFLEGYANKME